jgi:hypothetical protein
MYIGAVLCALISVVTIYQITVTQDTGNEWMIWMCVLLGFSLVGFGYLYESRYKKDHSEEESTPPNAVEQNST